VAPKRTLRPESPSWDEAKLAIAACRDRKARVELPSKEYASAALAGVIGSREVLAWERAMSQLAATGATQVATLNAVMNDEHLPVRLKAELALISAIHNRAWYAAGHAIERLRASGASADEIEAMFDDASHVAAGHLAAHRLAAKSTSHPHLITDADIAGVREHFGDAETAQILYVICMSNMFDRFTEALCLTLEDRIHP
jgi:alkylhydroperoxidase family enzyme